VKEADGGETSLLDPHSTPGGARLEPTRTIQKKGGGEKVSCIYIEGVRDGEQDEAEIYGIYVRIALLNGTLDRCGGKKGPTKESVARTATTKKNDCVGEGSPGSVILTSQIRDQRFNSFAAVSWRGGDLLLRRRETGGLTGRGRGSHLRVAASAEMKSNRQSGFSRWFPRTRERGKKDSQNLRDESTAQKKARQEKVSIAFLEASVRNVGESLARSG